MNDEVLETAPSDTEFVEYEYMDESSSSDSGNDEITIMYPNSINIITDTVEEDFEEESTEESVYLEDLETQSPIRVLSVERNSSSSLNALSADAIKNLWTLSIGNSEYKVLFPVGAELDIVDGVLINRSSSNVTGVVIDNSLSDSSYFHYTFTVLPFTSSSTQNTVYRYGARSYLTRYYTGASTSSLVTDVSYINADVVSRPVGANFSRYQISILVLLIAGIIVSLIGGLIRR